MATERPPLVLRMATILMGERPDLAPETALAQARDHFDRASLIVVLHRAELRKTAPAAEHEDPLLNAFSHSEKFARALHPDTRRLLLRARATVEELVQRR